MKNLHILMACLACLVVRRGKTVQALIQHLQLCVDGDRLSEQGTAHDSKTHLKMLTSLLLAFVAPATFKPHTLGVHFLHGRSSQILMTQKQALQEERTQAEALHKSLSISLLGGSETPFDTMPHVFTQDLSYPWTHVPQSFLDELFRELRPEFLVEVGCYVGGSSRRISKAAVATSTGNELPCLLCIDTFLGTAPDWLDADKQWLQLEHGFPRLYWQFLENMKDFRNVVVPFPCASLGALHVVQQLALQGHVPAPTFIYLDTGHQKGETFHEIRQSFQLLAEGGVIVGDDLAWPAVEGDVREFVEIEGRVTGAQDELLSKLTGVTFNRDGGYWVLNEDSESPQWLLRKACGPPATVTHPTVEAQFLHGRFPQSPMTDKLELQEELTSPAGALHKSLSFSLLGAQKTPFDTMPHTFTQDLSYPQTYIPQSFLEELFKELHPEFLVEIGCYVGGSSRRISKAAVAMSSGGELPCLLCIDTFLGDALLWLEKDKRWLQLEHGFPRLYWQFLENVKDFRNVVVPFPCASFCALHVVQQLVLQEDVPAPMFIYLDTGHQRGETFKEIRQAFQLLAKGGVLVGNGLNWPEVETELCKFVKMEAAVAGAEDELLSKLTGVNFNHDGGYWVLNKDSESPQWLLHKTSGELEDLFMHMYSELYLGDTF